MRGNWSGKNLSLNLFLFALSMLGGLSAFSQEESVKPSGELILVNQGISAISNEVLESDNITYLDLSMNAFEDELFNFPVLKDVRHLSLSYSKIRSLPRGVFLFENLERLYLEKNELVSVPCWLDSMDNLKILSLRGNKISGFSKCLRFANITDLDLSANRLTQAPRIKGNGVLKHLYLDDNEIRSIHFVSTALSGLVTFSASGNKIEEVCFNPDVLTNLRSIDLSGNKLKTLPEEIFELQSIRMVDVSGNKLCAQEKTRLKELSDAKKVKLILGDKADPVSNFPLKRY